MYTTNPQSGQTLSEYAVIAALVALVCIPALTLLGQNVSGGFNGILGNSTSQPTFHAMSGSGSASASSGTPIAGANLTSASGSADSSTQSSVQTAGANGNLEALQNNVQDLQALYDQQTDPNVRLLLAQLLAIVNKPAQYSASGPAENLVTAYQLGDVSVVSMRLADVQDQWTSIQGSPEFGQLNAADQARLTQIMDNFHTQAQYFTQN